LYPMRRRAGAPKGPAGYGGIRGREADAFERISWDEALDGIAARLGKIAAEFGPESILPYSYAGTIGQLGYGSMDRRFFHRLGASQLDRTICSTAGEAAMDMVYGIKLAPTPEDFARAGLIVVWGANVHGNNVHLWPFIEDARRNGAKLVVIDPYRTRTAALADEHLAIHMGTDAALALGMMHVILREGLEDAEYIARCTVGFAELKAQVLKPENASEAVAQATGIPAETIVRLAREYAVAGRDGRKPAAIRLNYGIQRSQYGGNSVRAVAMLPLLTGAWRYRGGGLQLSTSGAFAFNSKALRMPELMQASPLGREARVVNMIRLGEALTTEDAGVGGPPVKALFVYNSNPAAVAPNQNNVLRGMRRDDLYTVVHEQFFTDTTDYADVVLPAVTFLETKDVQGAYGHYYAQMSEQSIEPLGEARNNITMFGELAQRMGFTEACFRDREDELIDQALTMSHPWVAGITRERLEREKHVVVQMPVDAAGDVLPFSMPEWFRTPSGRGQLAPPPVFVAPVESRAHAGEGAYPLEFLPRKSDNYLNSTFMNIPAHQKMEARTTGVLEMHETDAAARGIAAGDEVEVFNARGSVSLRAVVNAQVAAGVVSARTGWSKLSEHGGNVNRLTSERVTDMGGGPTYYSTLVEVRRAGNRDQGIVEA
ncbi:MAG: molybdopterin-dependent oxidoreductase, partial [Edaphobacter sp.]